MDLQCEYAGLAVENESSIGGKSLQEDAKPVRCVARGASNHCPCLQNTGGGAAKSDISPESGESVVSLGCGDTSLATMLAQALFVRHGMVRLCVRKNGRVKAAGGVADVCSVEA